MHLTWRDEILKNVSPNKNLSKHGILINNYAFNMRKIHFVEIIKVKLDVILTIYLYEILKETFINISSQKNVSSKKNTKKLAFLIFRCAE